MPPRALPKALKSKTSATPGALRQVGLILSWATPSSQPRPGSPPTRRTLPSPVAAAAGVRSRAEGGGQARSFVLRDGAGAAGGTVARSCQSRPAKPSSSPPAEPTLRSRGRQRLSAPAQSSAPAARSS